MHEIQAKSILSPRGGINVYRGCTHGCIYCDSRSTCYQMDHAFEDVAVKVNAPELLEEALRRKRRRCMVGTGSMCDPYLPLERELNVTRRCLEAIERAGLWRGGADQVQPAPAGFGAAAAYPPQGQGEWCALPSPPWMRTYAA